MSIKLSKFKSSQTALAVTVIALTIGVIMTFIPQKETEEKREYGEKNDLYEYTENLENKLEEIIGEIKGAGDAYVMITLESSYESVFANNAKTEENNKDQYGNTERNTEKEIALAGIKGGEEQPILLKELCPRVKGVFVVCEGGSNEIVSKSIKNAVTALFGIAETRVSVICGAGNG